MFKYFSLFIYSPILIVFLFTCANVSAAVHSVTMKSLSFDPKSIEIKQGDSIDWTNKSYTEHSATGESFETGLVAPQKTSKKIEFKNIGTFSYHCSVHGKTMSGQIKVSP